MDEAQQPTRAVEQQLQVSDPWAFMQAFCSARLVAAMRDSWTRYLVYWGIEHYPFWNENAVIKDKEGAWEIWASVTYLCMKDDDFSASGKLYSRLSRDSYMVEQGTTLMRCKQRTEALLRRQATW